VFTPEERAERVKMYRRSTYARYRDKYIRAASDYQKRRPEVNREASRRYRAANPDKRRDTILRYRYKLSLAKFLEMAEAQGWCCSHCGTLPKRLYVDHDHGCCPKTPTCGKCTRGLLCNRCNTTDAVGKKAA